MLSRRLVLLACTMLPLFFGAPACDASESLDALLLAYVEAWNTGELDRLEAIVTADFKRHAGPDESCSSRAELERLIEQTRTIYKHLRFTVDDHMTETRGGAFRGSFYGVHAEVNRVVEFPLMTMVRFEDGLIAEEWILGNNFLVLVGLGYQLTPPGFEVIEAQQDQPAEGADTPMEEGR